VTLVNADTGEVLDVHPVADLFPMLPDDELDDLAADIAERGLLQPIVLDAEGRILDGRNRCAACWRADVEPQFTTYDGDDPDGFALAANLARRSMTKGQKAVILARAYKDYTEDDWRSFGVSKQYVSWGRSVLRYAPDLADAVVTGANPLSDIYKVAQDRKKEADKTEDTLAELRDEAPDLADRVADESLTLSEAYAALRQRREDREGAIRRAVARLEQLVIGWIELVALPDNDDRDEMLERLNEKDRSVVQDIESIYRKATH
jgi:hypothetical protein